MRAATSAELAVLASAARQVTRKVKIANGSGTLVDYTQYVQSISIDNNVDQPIAGLTLSIRRDQGAKSFSPLRTDSTLNRLDDGVTFAPAITPGREIRVYAATTAVGRFPTDTDFKLLFKGYIDIVSWEKSPMTVSCRDEGGVLYDRWIESVASYGPGSLESVMQAVLDGTLGAGIVPLFTPTSPSFTVTPAYKQIQQPEMDAQGALAQLPGWDARYKWDDGISQFRFTLSQPPRTKTTPDYTFGPSRYLDVTNLQIDRTNIRNVITGTYLDSTSKKRETITVSDAGSIAKYGRRFYFVQEADDSPINTAGEMTAFLNAILSDLKDPKAEQEIELPFFWPADLNDLYEFSPNGVHYDTPQDWAVVSIRHELSDRKARTIIQVRGTPSGSSLAWLGRGGSPAAGVLAPIAFIRPLNTEPDDTTWALQFDVTPGTGGKGTNLTYTVKSKIGVATDTTISSGNGLTLPLTLSIARDLQLDTVVHFDVTDSTTGLSAGAAWVVPSRRREITTAGLFKRTVNFDSPINSFALASSTNDGLTAHASVAESGGKLVNRLLAKTLGSDPDTLDGTPEGTTYKRVTANAVDGSSNIDFSKTGFANKNGANVARSGTDATVLSTVVQQLNSTGGHALSTMQESGGKAMNRLLAKTLAGDADSFDGVPDGTTYKKTVGVTTAGKIPWSSLDPAGTGSDPTLSVGICTATNNGATGPPYNQLTVTVNYTNMPTGVTFDIDYNNGGSNIDSQLSQTISNGGVATFTGVTFASTPGKGVVRVVAHAKGMVIAQSVRTAVYAT